jgi:hypothetical protein
LERNDGRFRTRFEADRVKKERMPKRVGREMFSSEDDVDEDAEVLESARDRSELCDAIGTGAWVAVAVAAAAAAAASCSLECRRSARLRRELSGLRRRGSRIVYRGAQNSFRVSQGPIIGNIRRSHRFRGFVGYFFVSVLGIFSRLLFGFFHFWCGLEHMGTWAWGWIWKGGWYHGWSATPQSKK